MIYLAALLFGMVHPGSKLLLESGLDLSAFCLLYIGFRFLFQGLLLWRSGSQPKITRAAWGWLLALGGVGASLQLAEFFGISKGLPVPIVTFLVYTHPVWSLALNRIFNQERITARSLVLLTAGLCGIGLVVDGAMMAPSTDLGWPIASSLAAGVLIALWVSLAHRARSEGVSSISLAFYYDGFAFAALLFLRIFGSHDGMPSVAVAAWLSSPLHLVMILFYATAVGVLPNMLFYQGQLKVGARAAGLVLLLEPVVSSLLSHWIWKDELSETFAIGSLLILAAAVPPKSLTWMKTRILKPPVVPMALLACALYSASAQALTPDPPSTHGMLIFGTKHVYLSHLPMFHRPHDYQVLMEVQLDGQAQATLIADQALHQSDGTFYTLVPESFVLPTVVNEKRNFHGTLFRGHFERGGTVLVESVSVTITSVLDFEKFVPADAKPATWRGFLFGVGDEAWLVHRIVSRPDFDQVIHVQRFSPLSPEFSPISLALDDLHPLADSSQLDLATPSGVESVRNLRTLYLETGDLQ